MRQALEARQSQRLALSGHLQRAIELLRVPLVDLSSLLATEVEENPLLEYAEEEPGEERDDLRAHLENSVPHAPSRFERLLEQARSISRSEEELRAMEVVLGNLDESGTLALSFKEISLFHGISQKALAEAHQRLLAEEVLPPDASVQEKSSPLLLPDLIFHREEEGWRIEVNEEPIPSLTVNPTYLEMLHTVSLPKETRAYLQEKALSCKWLLRGLHHRHATLSQLGEVLLRRQGAFFSEATGALLPMTMKQIAGEMEVHESTIARMVTEKYLLSPRGLHPLRFFFTQGYRTEQGTALSTTTVKEWLYVLLREEDRNAPLSDEELALRLQQKGAPCARRTVAKYRRQLGIGTQAERKK